MEKVKPMIDAAGSSGVSIQCLQEARMRPFAFCTVRRDGVNLLNLSIERLLGFLQELAQKYNMVNNHVPSVGDFNESTYYMEGNTGHPVIIETSFGNIAVNICYGMHHPLNWLAFGLNGAEIVFNPSATVGELSEPMWPIEAGNAATANSCFVGSINCVGTVVFPNPFTSGNGKPQHSAFGHIWIKPFFSPRRILQPITFTLQRQFACFRYGSQPLQAVER